MLGDRCGKRLSDIRNTRKKILVSFVINVLIEILYFSTVDTTVPYVTLFIRE